MQGIGLSIHLNEQLPYSMAHYRDCVTWRESFKKAHALTKYVRNLPGKRTMDIAMMRAHTTGHDVTYHIIYARQNSQKDNAPVPSNCITSNYSTFYLINVRFLIILFCHFALQMCIEYQITQHFIQSMSYLSSSFSVILYFSEAYSSSMTKVTFAKSPSTICP